jgi:hypothetical protein
MAFWWTFEAYVAIPLAVVLSLGLLSDIRILQRISAKFCTASITLGSGNGSSSVRLSIAFLLFALNLLSFLSQWRELKNLQGMSRLDVLQSFQAIRPRRRPLRMCMTGC